MDTILWTAAICTPIAYFAGTLHVAGRTWAYLSGKASQALDKLKGN